MPVGFKMETNPPTINQPTVKKPSNKKKIIALAAVLVIAISAVGASFALISTNRNTLSTQAQDSTSSSWITKGAYATYEGQTSILSYAISFTAKLEIVDFNATHVQVRTDFNMSSPFENVENTTTTWVNRQNMTYQPEGLTLNNTYTAQVTIAGLGTRSCTVYQYESQGLTATYYVDSRIQWPIKMTMSAPEDDGQSYSMDVNLVATNISGL